MTKNQPLLSICIPTYNRAKILDVSLKNLLPQINKYIEYIELIISDNASFDNTHEIILKNLSEYQNINVILLRQDNNIEFYGNSKKCRELSSGKYFWLLSDNEHILPYAIEFIITELKKNDRVGVFFLRNEKDTHPYVVKDENVDSFFSNDIKSYLITLISAVILKNNKKVDEEIYKNYKNNAFIGFLFLGTALLEYNNIRIIEGKIFYTYNTYVSFSIFSVWTIAINECLDFLVSQKLISNKSRNSFTNSFLINLSFYQIFEYLIKGKIFDKKFEKPNEILKLFDKFYFNNPSYLKNIRPLFFKSKFYLFAEYYMQKFINKLKRTLSLMF
ncbi:MAG TPA: glycosyltransferase family 2 protein [Ignavibacteria bacterium]